MTTLAQPAPLAAPRPRNFAVWLALALPPLMFLILIVAASVYFGAAGTPDAEAIAAQVQQATPVLLVIAQLAMLGIAFVAMRSGHLTWQAAGWKLAAGQSLWREGALGVMTGVALGFLYVFALSPIQTLLQQTLGDYVPAGETMATVGASVLPFFIANVLLAPFVEESLYRGYAYDALRQRYGLPAAFIILGVFFGLLHWAGGFWYMLLTGLVAGGLFTGLRAWRGSLIAPFTAHLALNLVEFLYVWLLLH